MPPTSANVAEAVKQRRLTLRQSQRACSIRAGVSPTTWASLEKGEPVSEQTLVAASTPLRWPDDWFHRLNDGSTPEDLPDVEHVQEDPMLRAIRELTDRVAGLEQLIRRIDSSEGD